MTKIVILDQKLIVPNDYLLGFCFGVEILLDPQRIDTRVLHVLQYFVTNTIQIDKSSYNFTNLTIFDN